MLLHSLLYDRISIQKGRNNRKLGDASEINMRIILGILAVIFAVYLFFLLISNIDFGGMSFSEIKLILSICAGIAVVVISAKVGVSIIYSALLGFVTSAILYALILFLIEHI